MITSRKDAVRRAIFEALGTVTINYKNAKKLDKSAAQIAEFVEAALLARDRQTWSATSDWETQCKE